jgi:hypothetical protein
MRYSKKLIFHYQLLVTSKSNQSSQIDQRDLLQLQWIHHPMMPKKNDVEEIFVDIVHMLHTEIDAGVDV